MNIMKMVCGRIWSRYCLKSTVSIIFICSVVAVFILHKLVGIHPQPSPKVRNAGVLLREGFFRAKNDLDNLDLLGKERQQLSKELKITSTLDRAIISKFRVISSINDTVTWKSSQRKYILRSDIRKALQNKMLKRTHRDGNPQECLLPELTAFDDSVKHHVATSEAEPLKCGRAVLTDVKDKRVVIKKFVARMINNYCYVSTIYRLSAESSLISLPTKVQIHWPNGLQKDIPLRYNLSSDFIAVLCLDAKSNGKGDFEDALLRRGDEFELFFRRNPQFFDVHASIIPQPEVLHRIHDVRQPRDGLGLNVIMLGLKAASKMDFLQQLPKTAALLEKMGSIFFEGYSVVNDTRTGALIPILTGKTEFELSEMQKDNRGALSFNSHPMIWKEFSQNGYATMYAEDAPYLALFTSRFKVFQEQPADHFMPTLWNAVKGRCLGHKSLHNVVLDYLYDYMTEYQGKPHFAVSFLRGPTHANFSLNLIDDDLERFLISAQSRTLLSNTMFILFSDPGFKHSAKATSLRDKLGELLPFMSITLPELVQKHYSQITENLEKNSRRLTTPFDVHETLRSVIHFKRGSPTVKNRGISFFHEIPSERTCDHAQVAPHMCACLSWVPADLDGTNRVAFAIIESINKMTEDIRDRCAKLRLSVALHAEKRVPNEEVLHTVEAGHQKAAFSHNSSEGVPAIPTLYRVTVEAQPGGGLYSGNMLLLPQSRGNFKPFQATEDVNRINGYADQASCIQNSHPHLMSFCYCKKSRRLPKRG